MVDIAKLDDIRDDRIMTKGESAGKITGERDNYEYKASKEKGMDGGGRTNTNTADSQTLTQTALAHLNSRSLDWVM